PSRFIADIPEELIEWERSESAMATLRQADAYTRSTGPRSPRSGYGGYTEGSGSRSVRSSGGAPSFGSATPRKDVPSLDIGDRVTHDSYGMGRVVDMEKPGTPNAVAHIDFGGGGSRHIRSAWTRDGQFPRRRRSRWDDRPPRSAHTRAEPQHGQTRPNGAASSHL